LTDGEPTVGIKDFSSIVGQAAEQKSRGITLTALGFGPDYNEELLAGIARRTGGNYYYISRPDLIPEVFRKEMESLLSLVARNIKLRLNLTKWAQVRQIHGMSPTYGDRVAEIEWSDLEQGASLTALVDVDLGTRPAGKYRILKVEIVYDDCTTGLPGQRMIADAVIDFTSNAGQVSPEVNPIVASQLALAEASRNLERTVMGIKTQMITTTAAAEELQKTQMFLIQQGRQDEARQIGDALQGLGKGDAEKTLIGTIYDLDRGKQR
jgi:Ca-activated chloride channel family protein